jgi:methylenetetrahydrofolate reductase (NADPH)
MKVIDIINSAKKPLFTFELLPPLKGHDIDTIYNTIDPLMEFDPAYINMTYHSHDVAYKERKDGLLEKQIVRKRPGTVALSAAIKNKYKITVVTHLICAGLTREETEDILIDLNFLGIHNLLVLRGDPPKSKRLFIAENGGHAHSVDMLKQVVDLNNGKYLDDELQNAKSSNFCIGIAGYPEKHCEAPNMDSDLNFLKEKVDAGAEYIVTQMFFDNQKYFDFVDLCRAKGINVPIVPGVKPMSSLKDIELLPQIFRIDIPENLVKEIKKCKTNADVREVGVEWTTKQSQELIKYGVPGIHYYTLGRSDNIKRIAKAVF